MKPFGRGVIDERERELPDELGGIVYSAASQGAAVSIVDRYRWGGGPDLIIDDRPTACRALPGIEHGQAQHGEDRLRDGLRHAASDATYIAVDGPSGLPEDLATNVLAGFMADHPRIRRADVYGYTGTTFHVTATNTDRPYTHQRH